MLTERLAIPLRDNPARQKFWRAVRLLGLVIFVIIIGYLIDRTTHYRTSSQRWPQTATLEARIIKTPRITKLVRDGLSDVQALNGAPWSLSEVLNWSKRELVLYSDGLETLGLVVDGTIPEAVVANLSEWGYTSMSIDKRRTLIIRSGAALNEKAKRNVNFWLTLPIFDGALTLKNADNTYRSLPFRFSSANSLDFLIGTQKYTPKIGLKLPTDTQLISTFTLPADLANKSNFVAIPAAFPGLQKLHQQSKAKDIEFLLGQDALGLAFVLAIPSTNLSLEELSQIAIEGAGLGHLSTSVLTNDLRLTNLEIRSNDDINLDISHETDMKVVRATTTTGLIFRLTQTTSQLIISNREPSIGVDFAKYSGNCLHKPMGFLSITALNDGFLKPLAHGQTSLSAFVASSKDIAYRGHKLRLCW